MQPASQPSGQRTIQLVASQVCRSVQRSADLAEPASFYAQQQVLPQSLPSLFLHPALHTSTARLLATATGGGPARRGRPREIFWGYFGFFVHLIQLASAAFRERVWHSRRCPLCFDGNRVRQSWKGLIREPLRYKKGDDARRKVVLLSY